jgi:glycosyltransferase involved in cell wall biosynthesis
MPLTPSPNHQPLVLIPSYNSGRLLPSTVARALEFFQPVWVVIDGSTDGSASLLEPLQAAHGESLRVLVLPENRGKGAAVLHGLLLAEAEGFTHALTMDADGQHPEDFIPRYLELSAAHPEAGIFGEPVFDASAPTLRVQGRRLSNLWADIETLAWGIGDSLFGMRLYPIRPLIKVFASTRFARRFDFDPEVAVRLAWLGVPLIRLPTPVRYLTAADGGVSQFRYLRDNTLLTWMHLRLACGALLRLPWLIWKRIHRPALVAPE